ncbi:PepSY domain-containing protein [Lactococcus petauri]|uniref:PepSY domain-containing protein n=1 Tax=Lactococcus petauri TaxID=1940789 RepID=UPI003852CD91
MTKQKFWIIITSILAATLVILSGLYFTFEFIDHQQKEQQMSYNSTSSTGNTTSSDNTNSPSPSSTTNPTITLAQSKKIAEGYLESQNIEAKFYKHSGIDFENGTQIWELEYQAKDNFILEFDINANTGKIMKFESDRWD